MSKWDGDHRRILSERSCLNHLTPLLLIVWKKTEGVQGGNGACPGSVRDGDSCEAVGAWRNGERNDRLLLGQVWGPEKSVKCCPEL